MKTLRLLLITILLLSPMTVRALDLGFAKEDGGQAGAFLDFAASARSLGMGRAHAAVTDDAGAVYWNPAGLSRIDRRDVLALYSALPEDTNFSFVSFAQPTVDIGNFGAGIVSLRSSDFQKRDAVGNKTGTFTDDQTALLLSHGIQLNERYSFGSTVKVVRHSIDNFSGTGYGLDFGLMARFNPRFQAAVVTHNLLAPRIELKSHADTYPRDLRFGLKYQPREKFMAAFDLVKNQNRSIKPNIGMEYHVNHLLALRAGLNETEIAAGIGLQLNDWGIDYAFGYHDAVGGITDLGSSHRIGFHMAFGKKYSDDAAQARWKKQGQSLLASLRESMDREEAMNSRLEKDLTAAQQVVRHNGFATQDLYEAQGYISYYEADYERSFRSLSDALAVNTEDAALTARVEMARRHMTEEKTRQMIETGLTACKENFNKGDYRASLTACESVLSLNAGHVEAKVYADDARQKIYEPVERELKIANVHFEQGEYLDVLKHANAAQVMDSENVAAAELMTKALAALENQAGLKGEVYEVDQNATKSRQFYGQGLVLYSQGKLQDAATAWGEAVKFDNKNALARNAYNRALTEIKEKAQ